MGHVSAQRPRDKGQTGVSSARHDSSLSPVIILMTRTLNKYKKKYIKTTKEDRTLTTESHGIVEHTLSNHAPRHRHYAIAPDSIMVNKVHSNPIS